MTKHFYLKKTVMKLTTSAFLLRWSVSNLGLQVGLLWLLFFSLHLFSMFLKVLLGFLAGVWLLLGLLAAALPARNGTSQGRLPPPLLLVSFDGFRADYLKTFPMTNLKRFYSQGVLVKELNNIFITKTFPNHYTLVTLPVSCQIKARKNVVFCVLFYRYSGCKGEWKCCIKKGAYKWKLCYNLYRRFLYGTIFPATARNKLQTALKMHHGAVWHNLHAWFLTRPHLYVSIVITSVQSG